MTRVEYAILYLVTSVAFFATSNCMGEFPDFDATRSTVLTECKSQLLMNDECKVALIVIDRLFGLLKEPNDTSSIVLIRSDSHDPLSVGRSLEVREAPEGVSPMVLSDFDKKNKHPRRWPDSLVVLRPMRLISRDTFERSLGDNDWSKVQKKYPGALSFVTVSRPLFFGDDSYALVSYSFEQGAMSGGGALVLLRKGEVGWSFHEVVQSLTY